MNDEEFGLDPDSDMDISEDEHEPIDIAGISDQLQLDIPSGLTLTITDNLSSWTSGPFIPVVDEFESSSSCINHSSLTENSAELDFFEYFLNRDVMSKIVVETNRYYHSIIK